MARRPATLVDPTRPANRPVVFEGRFEPRLDVKVEASLREGGTSFRFTVEVLDLSVSGFRFETSCEVAAGLRLFLTLPSIRPLECIVAWREGRTCGARFANPLHPSVRDLIVRRFPALPVGDSN